MNPFKFTQTLSVLALCAGALVACGGDGERVVQPAPGADTSSQQSSTGTKTGTQPEQQGREPEAQAETQTTPAIRPKGSRIAASAPVWVGVFTANVGKADAVLFPRAYARAGRWILSLAKGSYNLSSPTRAVGGALRVEGRRMTFLPAPVPKGARSKQRRAAKKKRKGGPATVAADPCGTTRGTYRWVLEDQVMRFERIEDRCRARAAVLDEAWRQTA